MSGWQVSCHFFVAIKTKYLLTVPLILVSHSVNYVDYFQCVSVAYNKCESNDNSNWEDQVLVVRV